MSHDRCLLSLLLLPLILAENCRTCFELTTDNHFLQNIFTNLLDTQIRCSVPVLQECSGHKPDCVSAMFSITDSALSAKFTVKIAQCSQRSVWESLFYRSSLGNAVGEMDVKGEVDVDVWNEENNTDHDDADSTRPGQHKNVHVDL